MSILSADTQAELVGMLASIRERAATTRRRLTERPDLNGRSALRRIEEDADSALAIAEREGLVPEGAA